MVLAPLLHAPSVLGSAEVIPVRGFAQPAALAGGFTDPPAVRLRTVILVMPVAVIRTETLAAMSAPTSARFGIHCPHNPTRQSRGLKPKARTHVKEISSRIRDGYFASVSWCNEIWIANLPASCGRRGG